MWANRSEVCGRFIDSNPFAARLRRGDADGSAGLAVVAVEGVTAGAVMSGDARFPRLITGAAWLSGARGAVGGAVASCAVPTAQ
ncbi:hypothetical protein MSIMFI_00151 [Mycobacterium simulans]|nr:hypothetical protein MSIMFI_00151 [Mycobacterium simulans]